MCNNSVYGGIVFPSFVANSCCNPCCRNSGSVGGTSNSNTSNRCTCTCTCNNGSTGSVGGTSSGSNSSNTMCGCGCRRCGCNSCSSGSVAGHVHRLLLRVQQLQFLPPLRLRELLHDLTIRAPSGALTCKPSENMSQPGNRLACLVKAGAPWYTDFDSE